MSNNWADGVFIRTRIEAKGQQRTHTQNNLPTCESLRNRNWSENLLANKIQMESLEAQVGT